MNTAYIFIGRSGAGKGTQVALLEKKLLQEYPGTPTFIVETGKKFRELIAGGTYTGEKVKQVARTGKLPPPFIGVHMWSHSLIEGYSGLGAVFIDGTPRIPAEVPVLLSAIEFYGWKAHVINLCVSDEWAYERIKGRGRPDDIVDDEIWERIKWFHTSVDPSIALLRESDLVEVHDVHGEHTIEEVHRDICAVVGL